jgi:hypothetical protein
MVDTVVLSGEETVAFANSLFRPSADSIQKRQSYIDKLNDGVHITRNNNGLTADIDDLDLSFLDDRGKII